MNRTTVTEKLVTIPTYKTGPQEKNPLFIETRAYQGSTGKIYPVPALKRSAIPGRMCSTRRSSWKTIICM